MIIGKLPVIRSAVLPRWYNNDTRHGDGVLLLPLLHIQSKYPRCQFGTLQLWRSMAENEIAVDDGQSAPIRDP